MIKGNPPGSKEIINLLSKLKAETPDYPTDLLVARKAAFLGQASILKIQGGGRGGEGGQQGGGGGSGSALGGSTTAPGIALQAMIAFGLLALMLLGTPWFREKVNDLLEQNIVVVTGRSPAPPVLAEASAVATPEPTILPTEYSPTVIAPTLGATEIESTPFVEGVINSTKPNPGLHLGQTPGAPAAPGQGNPGNVNKPDKPDKPDKPEKPEKPDR
jgi:hypothetical protein